MTDAKTVAKWVGVNLKGSCPDPGIHWELCEQFLLGGGCDVVIMVTIDTPTARRQAEWRGVTLTDAQMDEAYVSVTLSELREKMAQGDVTGACDLIELLGTL